MRARKLVLAVALLALAGCAELGGPPPSCANGRGAGFTSNAPTDGTTGASGTSTTSNGLGSTIDPTAPPCR